MMSYLDKIKPVEKFVLIDQIIEKIQKLIENGDLNPGDFLPGERVLSEKLGVSRTSLRQALKALDVMGVLDIIPGKKTYIKESFSDILINPFKFIRAVHSIKIKELFEARRVLEEGIVQMAAKKAGQQHIHRIKGYLDDSEVNLDKKNEFIYSEFMFHQSIFDAADNKILTAVMNSLNELLLVLEKYEKDYLGIVDRKQSLAQHKAIFNAIKNKDPEEARLTMHAHLNSMESRLKKMEIME
jgi:GntR family transcriptional regulator, transcriptional repressor for pyruvate dehydrogenase complex